MKAVVLTDICQFTNFTLTSALLIYTYMRLIRSESYPTFLLARIKISQGKPETFNCLSIHGFHRDYTDATDKVDRDRQLQNVYTGDLILG